MMKKLGQEMIKLKSWSWKTVFGSCDRIGENHGDAGKGQVPADRFDSIKRGERENAYFSRNWETLKTYIFSPCLSTSPFR